MGYSERKQDNKKYKFKVKNNLKFKGRLIYGETDHQKKVIKINKKLSKKRPLYKRPINKYASRYPDVLDTINHEKLHAENPKMTEKETYKKSKQMVKRMSKPEKKKIYNLVH